MIRAEQMDKRWADEKPRQETGRVLIWDFGLVLGPRWSRPGLPGAQVCTGALLPRGSREELGEVGEGWRRPAPGPRSVSVGSALPVPAAAPREGTAGSRAQPPLCGVSRTRWRCIHRDDAGINDNPRTAGSTRAANGGSARQCFTERVASF